MRVFYGLGCSAVGDRAMHKYENTYMSIYTCVRIHIKIGRYIGR